MTDPFLILDSTDYAKESGTECQFWFLYREITIVSCVVGSTSAIAIYFTQVIRGSSDKVAVYFQWQQRLGSGSNNILFLPFSWDCDLFPGATAYRMVSFKLRPLYERFYFKLAITIRKINLFITKCISHSKNLIL